MCLRVAEAMLSILDLMFAVLAAVILQYSCRCHGHIATASSTWIKVHLACLHTTVIAAVVGVFHVI